MWESMRALGIALPDVNEQGAADLFAYFYSARFFERPADAGRGKRAFTEKHCADCHGVTRSNIPEAKPIVEWESAGSPIALVTAMWNHAATMRQEFAKRKFSWPELTSQDLADILLYVRSTPGRVRPPRLVWKLQRVRWASSSSPIKAARVATTGSSLCPTGSKGRRSPISAWTCGTIPPRWRPFRRA